MDVRQKRNKVLGERVVKALESRNMDVRSIWEVPLPYTNAV